jgi:predicted RNase H-like nuclease (RuvC/YqgF family)
MKIGSHATIIAGKLTDGPDKFVKAVTDWKAEHGGTLPSRETAHTLLRQVDPRAEVPESSKRQDELAQVRAQLTEARAAIRTLEKENRDLKAKIAKLEKKMSRPQPRA